MIARFVLLASVLLVPPLLAGCAPPSNDPRAECDRAVYQDPDVRDLMAKMAGTTYLRINEQQQLTDLKREARLRCLRAKGLAPPGGVEPVSPPHGVWPGWW